ncbi:MAG TPA: hypothetical protein VII49_00480 [Rhizomicrobium sp.]
MRRRAGFFAVSVALVFAAGGARADVAISSAQTQNMSCSGGVCSPTAKNAVLSVTDLTNLLASGNVTVTTTGSGVQANNIDVNTAFGWAGASALTLDAYQSLNINGAISVTGPSGLSLATNDGGSGGTFSITRKGSIVFQNLSSQLTVNGSPYMLVNSVSSMAAAIAANPAGDFALAGPYDASGDGTYAAPPIQALPTGTVDGLGNAISNLLIDNTSSSTGLGLFYMNGGTIQHLGVLRVNFVGSSEGRDVAGALVVFNEAHLFQDFVTGKINMRESDSVVGGLAGVNGAANISIDQSFADIRIDGSKATSLLAGGLAAQNGEGTISNSFSTGSVTVGKSGIAGGLVGYDASSAGPTTTIANCYAKGAVTGGEQSMIGGFIGQEIRAEKFKALTETSYSTGAVAGGTSSLVGGFVGSSQPAGFLYQNVYWDTTTSGTNEASGNEGNLTGVTGLTTTQLQSGLPAGFDPTIWGEKPKINGGLPYLIANPPPKR